MKKMMTMAEFEKFKAEYFSDEEHQLKYKKIHDRFESRVKGAINARDRARDGLSDEPITITLYDWILKYLSLTDRYDVIDDWVIDNKECLIKVDYITREIKIIEKE